METKSVDEPKIFAMKARLEKEESSTTTGTNSFREEMRKGNNGVLKGASKSYSKEIDDSKKETKSVRERKGTKFAKINSADQLDKTRSIRDELSSSDSKCDNKNSGKTKMGDETASGVDGRRQRRPFRDMIGKREQRREELEKVEGDIRQRLDMLECSVPAVMVWNIWRKAQGAPVCRIKRILEKQFEDTKELPCRSTPSRHYDCRVREVEAERKLALRKVEEARNLWSEKLATLDEQKSKLEKARGIQEEQKRAMERLNEEARILRETAEEQEMDESCRYGECGDTQCKRRRLDEVSSVTSIKSGDVQCLEKLQRLAEDEMTMKRDIAELERREEAYMTALQKADELWSKMEDDTVSATSALQEQLDMKTAANQQLADRVCELEDALEKCRTRMAACRAELEKFLSIEKVEATIGRDDDMAQVMDKEVLAKVKVVHRPIGKVDDVATVEDMGILAKVEVADQEILTKVEVADEEALAKITLIDADIETAFIGEDKYVSVIPEVADIAVDRPIDLVPVEDAEGVVQPEDFAYEEQRFKEVREYLAELDSLEDLYRDDGEPCAPDFVCNDVVSSPTGMTDEESTALGVETTAPMKELDKKLVVSEEQRKIPFPQELTEKVDDGDSEKKEKRSYEIPDVKIVEKSVIARKAEAPIAEVFEEDATVDEPITIPDDIKLSEIKKSEIDQDVVVQRDIILSWVDTIDAIREKAAKHPDCHAVKKDADILAREVSAYVGIKSKEIEEEDVTAIIAKEIPVEKKPPIELIAEPELLPKLKKEELEEEQVSTDVEFSTVVSVEDSFQPFITPIKEEKEVISNHVEKDEDKIEDAPKEVIIETKDVAEVAPAAAVPPIAEAKEERDNAEEAIPIMAIEKIKEIREPEKALPIINLIEKEKLEHPTVDVKEVPITDVVEETIKVEKLPSILDTEAEKFKVEEAPTQDVETEEQVKMEEPIQITDTIQEKMEIAESPVIISEVKEEVIETEESLPIIDITEEDEVETIQPITQPPLEIKEEEGLFIVEKLPETELIKVEEPSPTADTVKEEIETIQPVIQPPAAIEEKAELLITEELAEAELTELIKVQEVYEEREEEEAPPIKKEEIPEPVQPVIQPPSVIKKGEELPIAEKLPETELIKMEEPSPVADMIKEEPVQPIIQPPEIIEAEAELPIVEALTETELSESKLIEIQEAPKVQEIYEKEEKEEMPCVKKEEIFEATEVAEIALPMAVEKEKVAVTEKKPEIVVDEVKAEEKVPIAETKPSETKMLAIPIDPRLVARPYFVVAKITEKELLHIMPTMRHACTECYSQPPATETTKQVEITRTDVLQTKLVQITTQTAVTEAEPACTLPHTPPPVRIISEYIKPAELKASSAEIAGDRPEITGRKMLGRKRLKDQSTVTTAGTGSQTDKTSRVSYEPVVRDERERARVPTDELLRSIKIAAGLTRPDTEREIRTINYGGKSDEMSKAVCNCCLCGKTPSPLPIRPKLQTQPQVDAKTATPAAAATFKRVFIPPKIDRPIPHNRLCPDCKVRIQAKMSHHQRYRVEKIIRKISLDRESCNCATSTGKSSCRVVSRIKIAEKRDQSCSAKVSKQKPNGIDQEMKNDLQTSLQDPQSLTTKPSSPSCSCYTLEEGDIEIPGWKGNCSGSDSFIADLTDP